VSGTDKIALDDAIFSQLSSGALGAGAFHVGAAATGANQRIIYDDSNGNLYYDDDGNGAHAAILFAVVDCHPVLAAGDFTMI
jgi:Ca2+-binding RTX toxin-like protein